jgi:excisionase family DNA binding protein
MFNATHANNAGTISPEWLKPDAAARLFGLGRTSIYALIQQGKIRSTSIKLGTKIRGTRLVNLESLRAYLESQATGGLPPQVG